jgi:putative tryptophan/tyrosine transport system substrate-binding protein
MAIGIGRRQFISALGGTAVAWPLAARAQPDERVRRVGVLSGLAADDPVAQEFYAPFVQGLQQLGWTEGRNMHWSAPLMVDRLQAGN